MLARKTVATGALSRKLKAQLKASQAQDSQNSDDSFKSASEGGGTRSSDSDQVTSMQNPSTEVISDLAEDLENRFILVGSIVDVETTESRRRGGKNKREKEKESEGVCGDESEKGKEVVDSSPTSETGRLAICGTEPKKVEESSKKAGGSGSGEATEGLVNLGKQTDAPGSSIEETMADLLKKVGDSYKPKKKRTPKTKTPGTARTNKIKKAAPSKSTKIPLPRGRATRGQLKQREEEFQKALDESKKKRMEKRK
ncbi:uncharacterized protein [Nicotiana sylvestris]|uniref:Uncharacterized protein LOC104227507 n=1 Tax=Nicotiana sylvestris TaxID=4096 RepID=A0A1U7WHD7_NICSY|nr:PREDICTED: uncharacterized protein LOC104227507 [Nicotiana sylvestris]XP_009778059.1 PREDICTED: uncharacterized protein LOC104227507 [Nicotiana sylvestris]XP_009778060.1 PREDICTED: uncharacterized protein LOC104227507 [Nicotiana sylvestris]